MSFDISSLEVHIREILSSPNTDLGTISAKSVRNMLISLVPTLTPAFLKQNRKQIDRIIADVYTQVEYKSPLDELQDDEAENAEVASNEGSDESRKRKHGESDEENADEDDVVEDTHSAKKAKRVEEGEQSGKGVDSTPKKGGRTKKSAATVDSETGSEEEGDKKKGTRKKSTTGARGGFAKEFTLSEPLARVLGTEKLSRPQVVKQLWAYIKDKGLQNPQNRKEILLDANLKAVFSGEKIGMFAMSKFLGAHLLKE